MKLQVFQQIAELNHSFDRLTTSLRGLQSVPLFQQDLIRHALSDVEIPRVYANREFFDNFEKIVEDDAKSRPSRARRRPRTAVKNRRTARTKPQEARSEKGAKS